MTDSKYGITRDQLDEIFDRVVIELHRATRMHGRFGSAHHGYAVIKEELEELWEAIKDNDLDQALVEAVEVASSAIRFILDLGGG